MLFICLKIYFYDKIPEFVDYIKDGEGLNSVTNLLDSFLDGQSILELTAPINSASESLVGVTDFGKIVFDTLISNKHIMGIPLNFNYQIRDKGHILVRLSKNLKLVLIAESTYKADQLN